MPTNICGYDDSSNWGPRAKQFLKNVERQQQQGPLEYALQKQEPQEARRIINSARPEEPAQSAGSERTGAQSMADPLDEVSLSFAAGSVFDLA